MLFGCFYVCSDQIIFCYVHFALMSQEVEFVVMDCDEGWELDEYFFSFPSFLFAVK